MGRQCTRNKLCYVLNRILFLFRSRSIHISRFIIPERIITINSLKFVSSQCCHFVMFIREPVELSCHPTFETFVSGTFVLCLLLLLELNSIFISYVFHVVSKFTSCSWYKMFMPVRSIIRGHTAEIQLYKISEKIRSHLVFVIGSYLKYEN